ncbi:hypothetical protein FDP41_004698 [Naegleria fowleri]|uniref:Staphylococcal nuclease domain-containing protein 1 n=1 Tax=Naegleria fowleri TaxID=5763 RepID=A0A6A5BMC1_NAEFO|nr:uncharacterized protein FDP41_004698 [Naegleria fowleri]KAF0976022.1 hypothetical protein FDP41_004698 [Naegleria fowleri]
MSASLDGIVKSVVSGNTIKVCHPQRADKEKVLVLADVKTPRIGSKNDEDEFRVDYTVKETGLNYATIFLGDENINEAVVEAGFGEVKEVKNPSEDHKRLLELQKVAKENKIGRWDTGNKKIAKTSNNAEIDVQQLLKSFKSKAINVIVEYVLNGATLKVRLPTHEVVLLNLTGVYCPLFIKNKKEGTELAQPFAKEAKLHTEYRLLNRDVTVLFEGIDNTGNLHGSIIISADETSDKPVTYQEELLLTGYASVDERSAPKSKYAQRFRAAEQKAKDEKKCLWVDYQPKKQSLEQSDTDFTARVLEVLSGDTLKIIKNDGTEEKISLSNIKTPKYNPYAKKQEKKEDKEGESEKKGETQPWGYEAKELLRSKVAGKEIHVEVDYKKEMQSTKEVRRYCTVLVNKKSVAVELVREGFASVIKLRADEERSSAFDQLILAENDAQKRQKGIHGKRRAPNQVFTNVTTFDAVSKLYKLLSGKSTATKGYIEKVLSTNRFVINLPGDSSTIKFSMSGIATPTTGNDLAKEAFQYALLNTSCRDVELVLESVITTGDKQQQGVKQGVLCGQLLIGGKNFAYNLLENGFAITQDFARKLKKKKVREEQEEEVERPISQRFSVSSARNAQTIRVTDFEDVTTFYYHGADVVNRLKEIDQLIQQLNPETLPTLSSPSVGSLCLSQFTEDNNWYRAKIVSINDSNCIVLYSDFGNSEEKPLSSLKQVPAESELLKIRPCAQKARLAFVKPHRQLFRVDLETLLRDTLMEGEWLLTVEYVDNGIEYVTLQPKGAKNQDTINSQIVRSGLAFIDRPVLQRHFKNLLASYEEDREYAASKHLNLYEMGDFGDDTDDFEEEEN